jgi:hypothetical protein
MTAPTPKREDGAEGIEGHGQIWADSQTLRLFYKKAFESDESVELGEVHTTSSEALIDRHHEGSGCGRIAPGPRGHRATAHRLAHRQRLQSAVRGAD